MERPHPLDKLIRDDSLCIMETLVPFIDYPYKRLFILFIKYREITSILECLEDKKYITNCGFDCHPKTTEEMIENICSHMPSDITSKLNQMKQMLKSFELVNQLNQTKTQNTASNATPTSLDSTSNTTQANQNSTSNATPTSLDSTSNTMQANQNSASNATPTSLDSTSNSAVTNQNSASNTSQPSSKNNLYTSVLNILNES